MAITGEWRDRVGMVRVVAIAVLVALGAVTAGCGTQGSTSEATGVPTASGGSMSVSPSPDPQGSSSTSPAAGGTLADVAESAVFFGHQSVGMNILDGVSAVYAAEGLEPPAIIDSRSAPGAEAAFAHAYVGQNTDPPSKMADFAGLLRSGYGQWADFAFMKFCYVDVVGGTDVDALFAEYQSLLAQLEQEFPDVTFLHLTVPLTTEPGLATKLKNLVGKGSQDRSDNVARERFNSLVRAEYGTTGRLVDVAVLESTTPDGQRVSGSYDGTDYFALYEGYASDNGHLNATGGLVVAEGLLAVLADNIRG